MYATLLLGLLLASTPGMGFWTQGWLHTKLLLVVGLLVFTHFLARWRHAFERDANVRPSVFFRRVNEIPTVLMIGIVILVVVKPF